MSHYDCPCMEKCPLHHAMALIGGKIKVGLSPEELELMCRGENVGKVSRRDFATYLATGKTGATTVACIFFQFPVGTFND